MYEIFQENLKQTTRPTILRRVQKQEEWNIYFTDQNSYLRTRARISNTRTNFKLLLNHLRCNKLSATIYIGSRR